jgi:hypothetical protein
MINENVEKHEDKISMQLSMACHKQCKHSPGGRSEDEVMTGATKSTET